MDPGPRGTGYPSSEPGPTSGTGYPGTTRVPGKYTSPNHVVKAVTSLAMDIDLYKFKASDKLADMGIYNTVV